MVKAIMRFINGEFGGLHKAALLLGLSSIISSVLGLFRDQLLASGFGAGRALDIYYASFKIPDILYTFYLAIASVTVIIPIFLDKINDSENRAQKFINDITSIFLLVVLIFSAIFFILMPVLIPLLTPGFSEQEQRLAGNLSRILLLSPFLLGLSNIVSSVTQSFKKFFIYAASPVLYNAGIIAGIIFFSHAWGVKGITYGVVLGAMMHVGVQLPTFFSAGFRLKLFDFRVSLSDVKKVFFLSLPRTIGLCSSQLILVFITSMASNLRDGSISVFNFSYNLQSVPLSIIGLSFSVAAFPTLAKFFVSKEEKKFLDLTFTAARQIIFWSLPTVVLFVVLRAQIVRVILGYGRFGWNETRLTAASLGIFALSVAAQSLILLFTRAFFAAGKTVRPVVINVASSLLIIVLCFVFINSFESNHSLKYFIERILRVYQVHGTEVLAFPLAFSLGSLANALVLYKVFKRDFGAFDFSVRKMLYQSVIASVFMGFVSYFFLNVFSGLFNIDTVIGIFMQGLLSGLLGIFAWFYMLRAMKNRELQEIISSVKQKFWKGPAPAPDAGSPAQ